MTANTVKKVIRVMVYDTKVEIWKRIVNALVFDRISER
jgi:hypothetical protein